MTDKEKAKAYDEALERARKMLNMILDNELLGFPDQIREIFPQLRESEDKRMFREIKRYLKEQGDKPTGLPNGTVAISDMIAWLEKQKEQNLIMANSPQLKEQKPAGWSEEDENYKDALIGLINEIKSQSLKRLEDWDSYLNWIKSLKYRIQPERKWSAEDSRILYNVKAYIGYAAGQRGVRDELFKEANEWLNSLPIGFIYNKNYNEDMVTLLVGELEQIASDNNAPEQYQVEINWLKSLRPSWKPNEHQMTILKAVKEYVGRGSGYWGEALGSLIEDLEKL